jgi:CDP-paratose 2-epimerase
VLCRELTGNEVPISSEPGDRPGDVPIYVSDCRRLFGRTEWRPSRSPRETLAELSAWIGEHADQLRGAIGIGAGTAR